MASVNGQYAVVSVLPVLAKGETMYGCSSFSASLRVYRTEPEKRSQIGPEVGECGAGSMGSPKTSSWMYLLSCPATASVSNAFEVPLKGRKCRPCAFAMGATSLLNRSCTYSTDCENEMRWLTSMVTTSGRAFTLTPPAMTSMAWVV